MAELDFLCDLLEIRKEKRQLLVKAEKHIAQ
jgi:hypothetical protein